MDSAHYFSATPDTPERRRSLTLLLAGREVTVQTANGIFSPDGLDKGTAAMLRTVPVPPATGRFLDVGSGWGPLALTLGLHSPQAEVTAVEVNDRAARLCRDNAAALGLEHVTVCRPEQVPESDRFDLIWSNPPIRIGKAALHDLLRTWLPRLRPGGEAYLVVSKNLGGDSLQRWITTELALPCTRYASAKGFRVLAITG